MKKKVFLTILAGFQLISLFAIDTLKLYWINEVTLTKSLTDIYAEDRRVMVIDSITTHINKFGNIGHMLSGCPQLNIRQYGAEGSISMISVHGLRTNHTQVNWNGFPINSMTTGDNDLSLVPAFFFDQVSLVMGAPGSLYGSGTFGGVIELNNMADFDKQLYSQFSYETGSFGSNKYNYILKTGNSHIQYGLNLNYFQAENNFIYRDSYLFGSPEIEIRNNTFSAKGIMQNLHIKLSKNFMIDAGLWVQLKNKEIPDIMGKIYQSYGVQKDKTNKAFISATRAFSKSSLIIKSGFFNDFIHYKYKTSESRESYDIDDTYDTYRSINQVNYRYYLSDKLIIDAMTIFQYAFADISNYRGKVDEKRLSLISAAKYKFEKTVLNFSIREEIVDKRNPQLLLSAGVNHSFSGWLGLQANIANKYRTPTFNERYWRPGGNPNLVPEEGLTGEVVIKNSVNNLNNSFEISQVLFYTNIRDLIQWLSLNGILQPLPEKEVESKGYELNSEYSFRRNAFKLMCSLNYAYTFSTFRDHYTRESYIGNYMVYSPVHSANGIISVRYKLFQSGLISNYTGKRYTTEDNSEIQSLPGFSLVSFFTGYQFKLSGFESSLDFRIENIFNTSYEVIKAYAMPGRAFYISLTVGFNKY